MSLWTKIQDRVAGITLFRYVRFDDVGFSVIPYEKPATRVAWADVREIFAFKQDLFSVDQICLGFCIGDAGRYIWVGEDDGGFKEFGLEVERRFNGIPNDWFGAVAMPPFEEKRTTLWRRP